MTTKNTINHSTETLSEWQARKTAQEAARRAAAGEPTIEEDLAAVRARFGAGPVTFSAEQIADAAEPTGDCPYCGETLGADGVCPACLGVPQCDECGQVLDHDGRCISGCDAETAR